MAKARFSGFVSNGRVRGKAAETAATQAASHTKACRLRTWASAPQKAKAERLLRRPQKTGTAG